MLATRKLPRVVAVGSLLILGLGLAHAAAGDDGQAVGNWPSVQSLANSLPCQLKMFAVAGRKAFVMLPKGAGTPLPWVWYAPTLSSPPDPSHEWMFRQWLSHGIAIAGVDVGESFGNPAGRAGFTAFYRKLTSQMGLARKACLLAQSRGGLMHYNWAAENPGCVACIAGIYPVCDLRSWPGLAQAAPAYGTTPEGLAAQVAQHNPIDRLAPLAAARVPILHLHGDRDTVVPLERNSRVVAERYRQLGGNVQLIVVPGRGHQVCPEFFHSQALVDFVIAQSGAGNRERSGTIPAGK
jgi:predicted esterase